MKKLLMLALLIGLLAFAQKKQWLSQINLEQYFNQPKKTPNFLNPSEKQTIVYEESVITKVVAEALPSVVTIGISTTTTSNDIFEFNPFSPFGQFPQSRKKVEQNIASGFVISPDGLIITNKHVVADTGATYKVLTNNKKKYGVVKIYRDPLNDLAILKINAQGLKPLPLGDSSHLKLGQLAIAIGTPLGEFTYTVTKGIISGLGRGITAGSPFEGYVEKLDNVIQTDAAINPGNSGGPLLNSQGEAIGINTAIAQEGQNIGFAIPVNVIKNLIMTFNKQGGTFERPYIGIRYKSIDRQTAVLNDLVAGAYIIEVIANSPADKIGLQDEDVIIEFDGKKIGGSSDDELAQIIQTKKIGDTVSLKVWRNKSILDKTLTLQAANQ